MTGLDRWPSGDEGGDTSDALIYRVLNINSGIHVTLLIVYKGSVTCVVINRTRLTSACPITNYRLSIENKELITEIGSGNYQLLLYERIHKWLNCVNYSN